MKKDSLFNKGMSVPEIAEAAGKRWQEFHAMDQYLNEKGKAIKEALDIIENECIFSNDIEELKKNINRALTYPRVSGDELVQKYLKRFLKNVL